MPASNNGKNNGRKNGQTLSDNPYDQLEKMKKVINGLINYYDSAISAERVTQILGSSNNRSEGKTGYIILTIIKIPVIS